MAKRKERSDGAGSGVCKYNKTAGRGSEEGRVRKEEIDFYGEEYSGYAALSMEAGETHRGNGEIKVYKKERSMIIMDRLNQEGYNRVDKLSSAMMRLTTAITKRGNRDEIRHHQVYSVILGELFAKVRGRGPVPASVYTELERRELAAVTPPHVATRAAMTEGAVFERVRYFNNLGCRAFPGPPGPAAPLRSSGSLGAQVQGARAEAGRGVLEMCREKNVSLGIAMGPWLSKAEAKENIVGGLEGGVTSPDSRGVSGGEKQPQEQPQKEEKEKEKEWTEDMSYESTEKGSVQVEMEMGMEMGMEAAQDRDTPLIGTVETEMEMETGMETEAEMEMETEVKSLPEDVSDPYAHTHSMATRIKQYLCGFTREEKIGGIVEEMMEVEKSKRKKGLITKCGSFLKKVVFGLKPLHRETLVEVEQRIRERVEKDVRDSEIIMSVEEETPSASFYRLLDFLQENGGREVGLFRRPGAFSEVKRLFAELASGREMEFRREHIYELSAVAKKYIRAFNGGIIKSDVHACICRGMAAGVSLDVLTAMVFHTMGPETRRLVAEVRRFLLQFVCHADTTLMPMENLIMLFAPNFFSDDVPFSVEMVKVQIDIVESLLRVTDNLHGYNELIMAITMEKDS